MDNDGKLIIGFYSENIIDRFDPATGKFAHEKINSPVSNIGLCQNGDMWLGKRNDLLFKAKEAKATVKHPFSPHPMHNLQNDLYVVKILEDKNQTVWVGTSRGLYEVGRNGTTGNWWLPCDDQYFSADTIFSVNDIVEDAEGNLWLATEQGLFVQSSRDKCLIPFRTPENTAFPFEEQNLLSLALNPEKEQIWTCTEKEGFYTLNLRTLAIQYVPPYTLHGDTDGIYNTEEVFISNEGTVWLHSSSKGGHFYHPQNQHFQWFNETTALESEERSSYIWMVLEDSNNHLWILSESIMVLAIIAAYR